MSNKLDILQTGTIEIDSTRRGAVSPLWLDLAVSDCPAWLVEEGDSG